MSERGLTGMRETEQQMIDRMNPNLRPELLPPAVQAQGPYGVSNLYAYIRASRSPAERCETLTIGANNSQRILRDLLDRLDQARQGLQDYMRPTMPPVECWEFLIVGKRSNPATWGLAPGPGGWTWQPPIRPGTTWHAQQVSR